ncbi:CaiB/BaiF CoA transferase family protein [Roseomonas marmotae]|uniref:CoA transferase n=1 Tax=Roseomonas marmotae TaxID=2768161 RepID=A0ABS3KGV4_9PROT|nr:CoA transferase [Roseomonas marmotae]MBO1076160.1 CoA transferase [Roseomonas marmotae]QTI81803.1 CoA transferase [Roseomonas marmotae]
MGAAAGMPPLTGLRVLDFTRVIAGPYLTMMLADLGCEVIKVESPGHGDDTRLSQPPGKGGESAIFMGLNRNKQSVVLDLAREEGRALARRLAGECDILVENFRPGAMRRLGLDYEALREEMPGLIYCSISGYGHHSRFSDIPGYDPIAQAETGLMYMTGDSSMPPIRSGGSVIDVLTGMHAGLGILSALHARARTGEGQFVDLSLYDTALSSLGFIMQGPLLTGQNPLRLGNTSFFMAPNGVYDCADGQVMISAGNNRLFAKLCEGMGLPEMLADPRFASNATRLENLDAMNAMLSQRLGEQPRDHWVEKLRRIGVPIGAVRTPLEALDAVETEASGMLHAVQHPTAGEIRTVRNAIHLSNTPPRVPGPAPLLDQHSDAILQSVLGLDPEEIAELRRQGAIGPASHPAKVEP